MAKCEILIIFSVLCLHLSEHIQHMSYSTTSWRFTIAIS